MSSTTVGITGPVRGALGCRGQWRPGVIYGHKTDHRRLAGRPYIVLPARRPGQPLNRAHSLRPLSHEQSDYADPVSIYPSSLHLGPSGRLSRGII